MSTKTNTNTNLATENAAENAALAVKADFAPITFTSKSAALNDSFARYNAIANSVASAIGNTKAIIAEAKKQAGVIFYGWEQTEAYKEDGYGSISEMVTALGMNKNAVLACIRYTKANKEHNNAFADMTVDNYAPLNSAVKANAARVIADKKAGVLDGMTQDDIKAYAAKVIAETPTTKNGKVVTLYHARTADGKEIDEPRPLADWKQYYNPENALMVLTSIKPEGGGAVYAIVPMDFSKPPFLMFCTKEAKADTKPAVDFRWETIKLAWRSTHSVDAVNEIITRLEYEPLTEAEAKKLG